MLQHIEYCGRTCYKSEDKITEDSCHRFVNMLREHAHGAMLEHGTVYLTIPEKDITEAQEYLKIPFDPINDTQDNLLKKMRLSCLLTNPLKHSETRTTNKTAYISTNYRVLVERELEWLIDLYMTEPTDHHPKRRTFKITCNRGVSHEFVRHRVFSFAQESQRYVNYSKDKFGKEIKVIKPLYFEEGSEKYVQWSIGCQHAECRYFDLLDKGATPQEAREVLPNSTATELIMTGFESDWEHFFNLRCAKDAHPQAQEIANMIREKF